MCPWTGCESSSTLPGVRARLSATGLKRHLPARSLGAALFILLACLPSLALARGQWAPLIRRLEADGFDHGRMQALFARPEVRFDPLVMAHKMNNLLDVKLAQSRPKGQGPELYEAYLDPRLILRARSFLAEQTPALRDAAMRYGVPGEVLVALLLVETKLGSNVGGTVALNTLASMALAENYALVAPHINRRGLSPRMSRWLRARTAQKSAWAYKELKALLVYAKAAGLDPVAIPGSAYGAIGICQFMPTNAVRFGEDQDGDGRVDLFSASDALLSTARFLSANGWRPDLPRERQLAVLYRYNHSRVYTRTVMAVADLLHGPASGS